VRQDLAASAKRGEVTPPGVPERLARGDGHAIRAVLVWARGRVTPRRLAGELPSQSATAAYELPGGGAPSTVESRVSPWPAGC
jgi:hypothetical protein